MTLVETFKEDFFLPRFLKNGGRILLFFIYLTSLLLFRLNWRQDFDGSIWFCVDGAERPETKTNVYFVKQNHLGDVWSQETRQSLYFAYYVTAFHIDVSKKRTTRFIQLLYHKTVLSHGNLDYINL